MNRHTLGTWRIERDTNPESGGLLHLVWSDETILVARTCFAPQSEANARLIAAAPDCYHALIDVLAQFDSGMFCRNTDADGLSDWAIRAAKPLMTLAAAKAAIAKANQP